MSYATPPAEQQRFVEEIFSLITDKAPDLTAAGTTLRKDASGNILVIDTHEAVIKGALKTSSSMPLSFRVALPHLTHFSVRGHELSGGSVDELLRDGVPATLAHFDVECRAGAAAAVSGLTGVLDLAKFGNARAALASLYLSRNRFACVKNIHSLRELTLLRSFWFADNKQPLGDNRGERFEMQRTLAPLTRLTEFSIENLGVTQPFVLHFPTSLPEGMSSLRLNGNAGLQLVADGDWFANNSGAKRPLHLCERARRELAKLPITLVESASASAALSIKNADVFYSLLLLCTQQPNARAFFQAVLGHASALAKRVAAAETHLDLSATRAQAAEDAARAIATLVACSPEFLRCAASLIDAEHNSRARVEKELLDEHGVGAHLMFKQWLRCKPRTSVEALALQDEISFALSSPKRLRLLADLFDAEEGGRDRICGEWHNGLDAMQVPFHEERPKSRAELLVLVEQLKAQLAKSTHGAD